MPTKAPPAKPAPCASFPLPIRVNPVEAELPDSDLTVLVFNDDWDEPSTIGFLDGATWRDALGMAFDEADPTSAPPTHWAHLPSLSDRA
jgi:hypothetical protein